MEEKEKNWAGLDVSKGTFSAAIDNVTRFTHVSKLPSKSFPRTLAGAGSFLKWAQGLVGTEKNVCHHGNNRLLFKGTCTMAVQYSAKSGNYNPEWTHDFRFHQKSESQQN